MNHTQAPPRSVRTWLATRPAAALFAIVPLATASLAIASLVGCDRGETPMAKMSITLTSESFGQGQPIPPRHAETGDNLSPPLAWTGIPDGTKELALICDDPDAPTAEPWVHWVLYKLPADARSLPQGVPTDERPSNPAGALQGRNTWPDGVTIGYRGPAPPTGVHRYYFKLYALDTKLDVQPGLDKNALLAAMKGHVLAQGELMGTYRKR
jgi:hypothetical protein